MLLLQVLILIIDSIVIFNNLRRKAANQINAIKRLSIYKGKHERNDPDEIFHTVKFQFIATLYGIFVTDIKIMKRIQTQGVI